MNDVENQRYNNDATLAQTIWYNGLKTELKCRACSISAAMTHTVTVPNTFREQPDVSFFECPKCHSLIGNLEYFFDYDDANASVIPPESKGLHK